MSRGPMVFDLDAERRRRQRDAPVVAKPETEYVLEVRWTKSGRILADPTAGDPSEVAVLQVLQDVVRTLQRRETLPNTVVLDPEMMDRNIQGVVAFVRQLGLETEASGDGSRWRSHIQGPYVRITCKAVKVVSMARRLRSMLSEAGVVFDGDVTIQAQFDPASGDACVYLFGLDDRSLSRMLGP